MCKIYTGNYLRLRHDFYRTLHNMLYNIFFNFEKKHNDSIFAYIPEQNSSEITLT